MKQRLKKTFAGAGLQPGPHVYRKAVIYHCGSEKMTKLSETHGSIYKIEPAKKNRISKVFMLTRLIRTNHFLFRWSRLAAWSSCLSQSCYILLRLRENDQAVRNTWFNLQF
jgi:hypothetical protein